jgi:hypothetical protein
MATVDQMDIPQFETAVEASEPPRKRNKSASDVREAFCNQIRGATGWFDTMTAGTWKNVTTDKSKRTLFVLQAPGGGDQFCTVGKAFNARLSREELLQPLPYDTSDEHTELSVALSMRPLGENAYWTNFDKDIAAAATSFADVRMSAIENAFVPLLLSKPEEMAGMPGTKLKKGFGKTKKEISSTLDTLWGGTGMNAEGDIVRFRRKCWNCTIDNLTDESTQKKWLTVADERGDGINYVEEHQPVRTGDTVLVWYRVLAQACAGNFHLSLEPKQVMRLGRGADGAAKGSAGLAASLAAAMERGEEV